MKIQWFPGHMAKTIRIIKESIKLVDVVIEVVDARIPYSSQNPRSDEMIGNKIKIIALNKADLADPIISSKWIEHYKSKDIDAFLVDSVTKKGIANILENAKTKAINKYTAQIEKGRIHNSIKIMVIGVPNVGKSTLINAVANKKTAKTADRPGVTLNKQWIRLNKDFSMLDMPGTLWPKFDNETVGLNLAFTGTIKDDILDIQELGLKLITKLRSIDPGLLVDRYDISIESDDSDLDVYDKIALKRGFILKGNTIDYERCAKILLDEFRGGQLGRISLEEPSDWIKKN